MKKKKLCKKFMKIQNTVWYTKCENLRDDLRSIIARNKKSYLRKYFQKYTKQFKRYIEQN